MTEQMQAVADAIVKLKELDTNGPAEVLAALKGLPILDMKVEDVLKMTVGEIIQVFIDANDE